MILKYERTFVFKEYAHNVLQGFPMLETIFPRFSYMFMSVDYSPFHKNYMWKPSLHTTQIDYQRPCWAHMNLETLVGFDTHAHELPLSHNKLGIGMLYYEQF